MKVRVHTVRDEAEGVKLYELRAEGESGLPSFDPGAHVDLHLPTGLVRSYSLLGDCRDRSRYLVAVALSETSRGGSQWIHRHLVAGAILEIGAPRNFFPLHQTTAPSVLFAGGIGITPLWAMVQELEASRRGWHLHYGVRSRARAALLGPISALAERTTAGSFHLYAGDEGSGELPMAALIERAPTGTHFYGCGPERMLRELEARAAELPADLVHVERFAGASRSPLSPAFTVRLARTGIDVEVPSDRTILEALRAQGLELPSSCEQGLCGACEARVVDGVPEHRDSVLSEAERGANKTMMVCCSRSKTSLLVLDL